MPWLQWMAFAGAVLALVAVAAAAFGSWRWNRSTRALVARLQAARLAPTAARYNASEIAGLPAPVQRFFRAVLVDGQPIVTAVTLEQSGSMDMSDGGAPRWRPVAATQRVVTRRPGFVWDARFALLPGLAVHVHDAYIAGAGLLRGAVGGLVPVVRMDDSPELARGELIRFFAECAWYPTALLPSQGVHWEAVDDDSARATLGDGASRVTLTFRFHPDGPIDSVRAEARGRVVAGKAVDTPWEGRFWNYATRGGMRVPLEGEVAWVLPAGARPYWRGTTTALAHDFAP
jgi:hypothetical protein